MYIYIYILTLTSAVASAPPTPTPAPPRQSRCSNNAVVRALPGWLTSTYSLSSPSSDLS